MTIDRSEFGAVTIDGTTYAHDVIIRLSGAVEKRKKKLSKKYYGTSHVISKDEAEVDRVICHVLSAGWIGPTRRRGTRQMPSAESAFDLRIVARCLLNASTNSDGVPG
jgi:hypothetical protein